jgi:hypothetical protein
MTSTSLTMDGSPLLWFGPPLSAISGEYTLIGFIGPSIYTMETGHPRRAGRPFHEEAERSADGGRRQPSSLPGYSGQ